MSEKKFSIREFKPSDLGAVTSLIHNTIDTCYSEAYPKEAVQFFKDWHCDDRILQQAKEGYTIVLEKNNKIIGTGTVLGDEIMRVFVEPALQKRGLGKLIMQKLEEKALSAAISVVKLCASLPSKKFYDSLGYVTLEETFLEVENGKKLDYYKMEKSLTV
ncbi:MAG: GNAT family N-acetyltransferase [Planctomycetota bacterium]|jgi:N-acetylglutamate synthase-like GNAT family acetyltransferase